MLNKIVLVEDNPLLRMDVYDILKDYNYEIVGQANDGLEAIEVCKKYSPDLVIMDIDMPVLDGIKASKIIRKENLAKGILLLTSYEDKEHIQMAKEVGAYGYLVKPATENILIPAVEMCLNKIEEFEKMKKDLDKVTSKLTDRKLVDRAKGILIREFDISENEAYSRIRNLSMDKRTTLGEIAKLIIIGYDK